ALLEDVQDVRLVLVRVKTLAQIELAAGDFSSRVVAGGQIIRSQGHGPLQQVGKSYLAVAFDAWVRRAPGGVLVDEELHNRLAEVLPNVEHVERNAQFVSHAPRV